MLSSASKTMKPKASTSFNQNTTARMKHAFASNLKGSIILYEKTGLEASQKSGCIHSPTEYSVCNTAVQI